MSAKSIRRMTDKMPRAAYCTGCGVVFPKMHLLFNHRGHDRCGGRFLPEDERRLYDSAKDYYEKMQLAVREGDDDAYRLYFHNRGDCLSRAYKLRKSRLDSAADAGAARIPDVA